MRSRVENQNDFNRDKEIKSSAEIIKVSQASKIIENGQEGHWTESNRNEVQQQQKRQKKIIQNSAENMVQRQSIPGTHFQNSGDEFSKINHTSHM